MGKALIGLATFGQIPIAFLLAVTDVDIPGAALFGFVLVEFGLWLFYLWDIRQNSRVPAGRERIWFWTIFLLGPFAEPVYFWRFIRGHALAW